MENCGLYASAPQYQAIGFEHVEDMSGTWGGIGGKSVYTDHLEQLGLMAQLRTYLAQLEEQPDEVRRYVSEPLPIPAEHYIDPFIARRVSAYVDQYADDRPSLLVVGFQGPHEPWDSPDSYVDRIALEAIPDPVPEVRAGDWLSAESRVYSRWAQYYPPPSREALRRISARYFGKIAQIDDAAGCILEAYRRKGWFGNTVVIFASDHGEMLGDLGRLSKSVFFESALRVPLILCQPDDGNDGGTCSSLVETIDMPYAKTCSARCTRTTCCGPTMRS